jgi:hypothetical protein
MIFVLSFLLLMLPVHVIAQSEQLLPKYYQLETKEIEAINFRLEQTKFNLDNFQKLVSSTRQEQQDYHKIATDYQNKASSYEANLKQFKAWLADQKASIGLPQILGARRKFFECYEEILITRGALAEADCDKRFRVKLNGKELDYIDKMQNELKLTPEQIKQNLSALSLKQVELANLEQRYQKDLKLYSSTFERLQNERSIMTNKLSKVKKNQDKSFHCNEQLPTIDLEEEVITKGSNVKGPFYNIPRDNQDGLGTCFANTAKNLLVSLSHGQEQASFLDMALQYQKLHNENNPTLSLDGGGSCATLNEVKKVGYCDQKFAYAELGLPHPLLANGKLVTVGMQAETIGLLQDYFHKNQNLNQNQHLFISKFMKNAQEYFKILKEQPEITFPLPIVENTPGNHWKLKELFYINNRADDKMFATFRQEVKLHDQKFKHQFINLIKNKSSHEKILQEYKKSFMPLLEKNNLLSSWDKIENFYMNDFKKSYSSKNADALLKSLNFVRAIDENAHQVQELIASCQAVVWDGIDVLEKILPLARALENVGVSLEHLTNSSDMNPEDLIQLIVAPSCANSQNRSMLKTNFICSDGHDFLKTIKSQFPKNEAQDLFRLRVMTNLLDGLAMGNSHPTDNGHHINTIVGLRFNPETNACEVKIRESQNGRSQWHDEGRILQRMNRLVEVSRD